jgi:hypothetical protein
MSLAVIHQASGMTNDCSLPLTGPNTAKRTFSQGRALDCY